MRSSIEKRCGDGLYNGYLAHRSEENWVDLILINFRVATPSYYLIQLLFDWVVPPLGAVPGHEASGDEVTTSSLLHLSLERGGQFYTEWDWYEELCQATQAINPVILITEEVEGKDLENRVSL